jgi:hypothetical protein
MAKDLAGPLPSATEIMKQLAQVQAEKAGIAAKAKAREDAEKQALIDKLTKASGVSDEERMKRAAAIIERAAGNGLYEVQVLRFPNSLCSDRGRAINNMEAGWEKTLNGLPREFYAFWEKHLKPRGYKIKYEVVDFSGGVPGDIGITLRWG